MSKDTTDLQAALERARDATALESVTARRAEAVAEGVRRRDAMRAEREDGDGSPDAA